MSAIAKIVPAILAAVILGAAAPATEAEMPPRPNPTNVVTAADYPAESVALAEQGKVVLQVTVGANGACKDARVTSSSGSPRLDAASIALCKSRFTWAPASRNGAPVETSINMNVWWVIE